MRNTVVDKGASKNKWNPVWKAFDVNNNLVNNKTNAPLIEMRLLSVFISVWIFVEASGYQNISFSFAHFSPNYTFHLPLLNYIDEKGGKWAKKEGLTFYVNNVTQTFILCIFIWKLFASSIFTNYVLWKKSVSLALSSTFLSRLVKYFFVRLWRVIFWIWRT